VRWFHLKVSEVQTEGQSFGSTGARPIVHMALGQRVVQGDLFAILPQQATVRCGKWFYDLNPVGQAFCATLFTWFSTALGAGLVFFFVRSP